MPARFLLIALCVGALGLLAVFLVKQQTPREEITRAENAAQLTPSRETSTTPAIRSLSVIKARQTPREPGGPADLPAPRVESAAVEKPYPPALAAFDQWLARYRAASPSDRAALVAEGAARASARREAMRALIESDPENAILSAIPPAAREGLPAEVSGRLEEIIAARGFYGVLSICNHGPEAPHGEGCRIEYQAAPNNDFTKIYKASIYGSRAQRLTEQDASLFGVALDDRIALHEDDFVIRDAAEVTNDPARAGQLAVTYMGATTFVATEQELPAHLQSLLAK